SERRAFGRKTVLTSRPGYLTGAFAVVVLMVFGLVSVGAIWGHPLRAPIYSSRGEIVAAQGGVGTWVPRWMAILGYPPFADLRGAEVSQKKPGWNSQDYQSDSVIGVQLDGVNLRYALAMKSFFAAASLEGSDLRRVQFTEADLRGAHMARANLFFAHLWYTNLHRADLTQANLSGAFLFHADLSRACLSGANMKGTKLISTDLTYADLRETHNLEPAGVKMQANHWDQAFYSDG